MLPTLIFTVVNRALKDDPWAAQSLSAFSGSYIVLSLTSQFKIIGCIQPDGGFKSAHLAKDQEPTLTIELPANAATLWLKSGLPGCVQAAKIRGNIHLANVLNDVMLHIRLDPEAFFAEKIGDIAAHRTISLFGQLKNHFGNLGSRLKDQFAEHVAEGHSVLLEPRALKEFSDSVYTLRDDVARLEQRIRRLDTQRIS